MNYPILAIYNADKNQSTDNLITNIRKSPDINEDVQEYENHKLYVHNIVTKYFETKILLCEIFDFETLENNTEIKSKTEGILIYFDSSDRSILKSLPLFKKFIEEKKLEFSILLCKELKDTEADGVTFNCIKSIYNKFDIIEIERKNSQDDDEPSGYEELEQALQVFPSTIPNLDDFNAGDDDDDDESSDVEKEMEKFESLLSQVMQFRPNTINMTREDRLNYAQNFAEVFEKLILNDTDDLPAE